MHKELFREFVINSALIVLIAWYRLIKYGLKYKAIGLIKHDRTLLRNLK